jgi:hypothetical protein
VHPTHKLNVLKEIGQDGLYGDDNYVYEEVDETAQQSSTTYSSFRKKSASTAWGIEETHLFYQVHFI